MSPELVGDSIGSFVWLAIYVAAAVFLAVGAFQVTWGPAADLMQNSRRCTSLLLATGATPLLDSLQRLSDPLFESARLPVQAIAMLAALVVFERASRSNHCLPASVPSRGTRLRLAVWLFLLATPTLVWSSWRLHETPPGIAFPEEALPLPTRENLAEADDIELQTDRGASIQAFRYAAGNEPPELLLARMERFTPAYAQIAMRAGPAELKSNCHGWVFAGGEYLIGGSAVERILQDNGYQPVKEPQPDDLIVYRDQNNHVLHTGVVKATGKDGFTLIESKWGLHGLFRHEPHQQSYSDNYAYYRSSRRGHRLNGRLKNLRPRASAWIIPAGSIASEWRV